MEKDEQKIFYQTDVIARQTDGPYNRSVAWFKFLAVYFYDSYCYIFEVDICIIFNKNKNIFTMFCNKMFFEIFQNPLLMYVILLRCNTDIRA